MPVKIRLARRGRKKRPYYHIVIADSRRARDGKFIESIGFYNPMTVPATIELDREKAYDWLTKGAQPTDTARAILKFKGVYYRKHLMRGVAKGALTEEKAQQMYQDWIDAKEAKISARREEETARQENFWKMVSGEVKPPKKTADEDAAEAFREGEETATDEVSAETSETESAETEATDTADTEAAEQPVAESEAQEAPEAPETDEKPAESKTEDSTEAAAEETPAEEPVAEAVEADAKAEEEVKEKGEEE